MMAWERSGWLAGGLFILVGTGWLGLPVAAATPPSSPPSSLRKAIACPQDLPTLTQLMLRDLPGYANRIGQRTLPRATARQQTSYVIGAGRPEFEPLPTGPGQLSTDAPVTMPSGLRQVFLTTLERQYTAGKPLELQQYHWLFLAQTEQGWLLAMMFSRTGSFPAGSPPTPPRESSQGIIGQAIQTWLRDCRAGAVRASVPTPSGNWMGVPL